MSSAVETGEQLKRLYCGLANGTYYGIADVSFSTLFTKPKSCDLLDRYPTTQETTIVLSFDIYVNVWTPSPHDKTKPYVICEKEIFT